LESAAHDRYQLDRGLDESITAGATCALAVANGSAATLAFRSDARYSADLSASVRPAWLNFFASHAAPSLGQQLVALPMIVTTADLFVDAIESITTRSTCRASVVSSAC
jgi:hypothetical protein